MNNYTDLDTVKTLLEASQDAERDMREVSREAHYFVDKRDGQWEPEVISKMKGRPRYTFDKCNPIIDQIAGEIDQADFTLKVSPAGGDSSMDTAQTMDGMIRNIRNMSGAESIFQETARNTITGGLGGWEIVQEYVDSDSFNQDLLFKRISNYVDRVWFDTGAIEPDMSDANHVFILQDLTIAEYEEEFPDAKSQASIGTDKIYNVYYNKPEFVTVGRIQYKKAIEKELVQMSNGAVYEVDEDFMKVKDELEAQQITVTASRTSKGYKICQRIFNNDEWLTDIENTVFEDYLPVIPMYGNFKVSDSKVIYRGVIEKLMDAQRVYNYARSREIEEGALSPRAKWFMTRQQAAKDVDTLATMNLNSDPVQTYTHVDNQPPPFFAGGAQINQGLQLTAASASEDINASAGLFSANMGQNIGLQSGVAIEQQIGKGDNSTIKWFSALEMAICASGRVLMKAIPKVYDATRQIRVIGEDGQSDKVIINQTVIDQQTGQAVTLNDLSQGQYDVVCEVGDAFKSRQKETAQAFAEIAAIDPTVIEMAKDVWFKNLNVVGMDKVAERAREQLVNAGMIPQDQLTEEEAAKIQEQQAQQQQQPDPNMLIAEAEMTKAQAEQMNAQNNQMELQIKAQQVQLEAEKINQARQGQVEKLQSETAVNIAKVQQGDRKLDQEEQKIELNSILQMQQQQLAEQQQQFSQVMQAQQQQQATNEAMIQALNTQAQTLKTLKEAEATEQSMNEQEQQVSDSQDDI